MLRLLPFVLLATAALSQDKTDLHLSVQEGQQLFFRRATVRTQVTELRGIELVFATKVEQMLQLEITEASDDGGAGAALRVLRVRGSVVLPTEDEPIAFDPASDAGPDAQGIGPAQSLIGRLPPHPVGHGEKWQREKKDDYRGTPMLTRPDYTLGRCDGVHIELLVAGTITTPEAKAGHLRLREGKVTGGDVLERSGLVLSATRKTETVSEGPSPVGEGSIIVRSTSEHTLVRISEAEAKPAVEDGAKGEEDKG